MSIISFTSPRKANNQSRLTDITLCCIPLYGKTCAGRIAHYCYSRFNGHTCRHNPHMMHRFPSITGYRKPSLSSCIVIAPCGQMLQQAVHPQQSFFNSNRIGTVFPTFIYNPLYFPFYPFRHRQFCQFIDQVFKISIRNAAIEISPPLMLFYGYD